MEGGGRSSFQPPSTGDRAAHQVHYCSAVYIQHSVILEFDLPSYRTNEADDRQTARKQTDEND